MSSFRTPFGKPWSRWVALGSLFGAFGHLGHEKSPKGAPKAPKGLPKVTKKEPFLELCVLRGVPKSVKKRYLKVQPQMCLKYSACHTFGGARRVGAFTPISHLVMPAMILEPPEFRVILPNRTLNPERLIPWVITFR